VIHETVTEFKKRIATEEDCRAYWIEARRGGKPACVFWRLGTHAGAVAPEHLRAYFDQAAPSPVSKNCINRIGVLECWASPTLCAPVPA
jgi:hypothetical protein